MTENKSLSKNLVETLENQIKDAAQRYYTAGNSLYTDSEFDAMVDHLKEIAPNSPVLTTGWGYDVWKNTAGEKFDHLYGPAGSLSKAYTWRELNEDLKCTTIYASLKLDGLSCVMYFRNGKLYRALTRGNGTTGIDITKKVKLILGTDSIDDNTFTGAVRGEIVMSYKNFEKYQNAHPDAKNPRNTAAGLINSKEYKEEEIKLLDILVYTIVGDEHFNETNATDLHMGYVIDWLKQQFDKVAPYQAVKLEPGNYTEKLEEFIFATNLTCNLDIVDELYPADGIVLTADHLLIDLDTHYIQYPSQAFKFQSEQAETTVIDVEWNLSKTCYLIPKIHVEPIIMDGTTVQYATGYNAAYIKDSKIGPGAVVTIEKCGEIIPNVIEIVEPSSKCEIPKTCPECGQLLSWNGVHLECVNPDCKNAKIQDLLVWLENICPTDNFGDTLRLKFLNQFFGDDLSIDKIMDNRKMPQPNPLFGTQYKLYCAMMDKLYGNDPIQMVDALKALNIPRLGDVTSAKLAEYPDWVETIFKVAVGGLPATVLFCLPDVIGVANAAAIRNNISKFKRLHYIYPRIVIDSVEKKGKVAITGKLSVKRADFEKELRAKGYEPSSSVTKDTKFLITDDPSSSSSKNKAADKFGVSKITESEFRRSYLR